MARTGSLDRPGARTAWAVREERGLRVPVAAGVTLAADLYRPATGEPVPAVLTLHYGRRVMGVRCFREFAAAGYATLVVDTRGVGESDGRSRPVLDPAEGDDGVAAVGWLAAQPWCTGAVGMWGLSYGAALTLVTASRRPPALRAIVPVMGFTAAGPDLVHPGGLPGGMGFASFSCIEEMLNDLVPPLRGADLADRRARWLRRLDELEPWLVDSWRHPPGDPVWDARRVDAAAIGAATFVVAGWRDLFCGSMLRAYAAIGAPKRLLVGPWLHELPERSPVRPVDSLALACRWWDRWLGDGAPGEPHADSVTVFVQGADRWGTAASWPPAAAVRELVGTAAGGLAPGGPTGPATPVAGAAGPAATLVAGAGGPAGAPVVGGGDPTVGLLSGLCGLPVSDIGFPLDQHDDDLRSVAFTSDPLPEPLLLAGSPVVTLALEAGTSADRCVARLADVAPDGGSTLVTTGLVPLPAAEVELDPSCYQLARGHRLRLVLTTADFPRLWPAESGGRLAVRTGPGGGTSVRLPVARPAALAPAELPEPVAAPPSGPAKFARLPVWRIAREQVTETVTLTIAATESRLFSADQQVIRERDFSTSASVSARDPAAAQLTATAAFRMETEQDGPVTVRAEVELRRSRAVLAGEVSIGDVTVFARKWSTGDGADR